MKKPIGVAALIAAAFAAAALAAYAVPMAQRVPMTGGERGQGPRFRLVEVPGGPRCVVLYWKIGRGLAVSCNWEKREE